jgi:hypothetical protein
MRTLTSLRHVSSGSRLKLNSPTHKFASLRPALHLQCTISMASPTLDDIFPIPGPRVSSLAPERWSGVTAASTAALIETVKADYEKFHVFFNDKHFHKFVDPPTCPNTCMLT